MKKEDILKFYQKYKFYIFPIVVFISALILIGFVIYPQTVELLTNQKAATELTKKSEFLATKVSALESYDEQDLKIKVNSAVLSLPAERDLAQILGLLSELTAKSGFSVLSISLGSIAEKGVGTQSYTVKIEATGPSTLLQNYLKNLENSNRLLRVTSIDTSLGRDQLVSTSLTIEALYSPAPGDFGSIDSPLPDLSAEELDTLTKLARTGVSTPTQTLGPRGKANPFE